MRSKRRKSSISYDTEVEIYISDILRELHPDDIIQWLENAHPDERLTVLGKVKGEFKQRISITTLQDEMKLEALELIWDKLDVSDIENIKV